MFAWYLLLSFLVFFIVDYKTIYNFIDSKLLYTSSGSKINYDKNNKTETILSELKRLDKIDLTILVVLTLILFFLLFGISSFAFSINPLNLNLGYKVINIQSLCINVWTEIKWLYNISAFLFSMIIIFHFKYTIITYIKEQIIKILNLDKNV